MDSGNYQVQVECEQLIKRASRAYAYMMGTMDGNEAWDMWGDLQYIRNCYTVVALTAQELVEEVIRYKWDIDYPDDECPQKLYDKIHDYADRAAEYIASNYEFHGYEDLTNWGTELIDEYAAADDYVWPGELGVMSLCASEQQETGG